MIRLLGLLLLISSFSLHADAMSDKAKIESARSSYLSARNACSEKMKRTGSTTIYYKGCMADSIPLRCKALVWVDDAELMQCMASCVGKNTVVGDCSN